jgi:DNA-binding response OmpR family regulator
MERTIMFSKEADYDVMCKPVILVAEDDPDQSDMLRERLESEGYAVETAFSGDVALRRLSANHYTVAIMDAHMTGLHGGAILRVCGVLKKPNATPVIMVSAFVTPEDIAKFTSDGAVCCFSKPLDMPKLMQFVDTMVKSKVPY